MVLKKPKFSAAPFSSNFLLGACGLGPNTIGGCSGCGSPSMGTSSSSAGIASGKLPLRMDTGTDHDLHMPPIKVPWETIKLLGTLSRIGTKACSNNLDLFSSRYHSSR
jgi:hypothetical protein